MDIEILETPEAVARRAAEIIAADAAASVVARARHVLGVSGGRTPWIMLRALGAMSLAWAAVHVLQVDERVAPDGDPDRNLTHLRESLLNRSQTQGVHIHEMPVTLPGLTLAALQYDATLRQVAGSPPVLDLVHLGLGPDGHTASLIPGDPVLSVADRDVAATGIYQGRQRLTLTYPILNRARRILWVVTGADKTAMLQRLFEGDESIPAGRIRRAAALIVADAPAAGSLKATR